MWIKHRCDLQCCTGDQQDLPDRRARIGAVLHLAPWGRAVVSGDMKAMKFNRYGELASTVVVVVVSRSNTRAGNPKAWINWIRDRHDGRMWS